MIFKYVFEGVLSPFIEWDPIHNLPEGFDKVMCGSRKFCQRGSNFDNVFFSLMMRGDPNSTKTRPSSARQGNAILMVR